MTRETIEETSTRYEGWLVAVASGVGVFVSFASLLVYTFGIFLKPLTEEFAWSRESVSAAFGIAAMTVAVCSPLLGYLLDRYSPRKTIVPCLTIFGCAFASLALLTPHLWHLYAVFLVLGIVGNGTAQMAYSRAVSSWFDRRRGTALALVMSGGALALSAMGGASLVGRLATGWMLDRFFAGGVSFVLLTMAALGTFLLSGADSQSMGVVAAVLIGLGMGGEADVTPYLISRYFGLKSFSMLYGVTWTFYAVAGAIGPILMGKAFDVTGSYQALLTQLAFATFAAAVLMLFLPRYAPLPQVSASTPREAPAPSILG